MERDRTSVQLKNPQGVYENYTILANFPFSSKDKKMSVLVTQKETGKTIYYVKGAEVVLESMVKASQRANMREFCELLANDGLRTLAFAQKELTEMETDAFM